MSTEYSQMGLLFKKIRSRIINLDIGYDSHTLTYQNRRDNKIGNSCTYEIQSVEYEPSAASSAEAKTYNVRFQLYFDGYDANTDDTVHKFMDFLNEYNANYSDYYVRILDEGMRIGRDNEVICVVDSSWQVDGL